MLSPNFYMSRIRSFDPIVYPDSRVLILGSMPSVRSLELGEYYGHRFNQFWRILAALLNTDVPSDYPAKKALLKKGGFALWDVLGSCVRQGSADADIQSAEINPIPELLSRHRKIKKILLNGKTAEAYFKKTLADRIDLPARYVPSSSPANAQLSLERKIELWRKAVDSGIV